MSEQDWIDGNEAAWRRMMTMALGNLPRVDRDQHSWQKERGDAIRVLREVCREFGDDDWPDDLYLPDVIEKHLARHLRG